MALRWIEIVVPTDQRDQLRNAIDSDLVIDQYEMPMGDNRRLLKLLVHAEQAEPILDSIELQIDGAEGFRLVMTAVEATLPRPKEPEEQAEAAGKPGAEVANKAFGTRISREELYNDIDDASRVTRVYLVMVALSTIVAAIGLTQDSVAVVIGAMVIAPLLGPNVALSLATTLGDVKLGKRALITNVVGLALAAALSILIGLFTDVGMTVRQIASRADVNLADIVLALATGAAGTLAFTTGVSTVLVGVMVAVALLPPLAAAGLLLGNGYYVGAAGAMLLLATNIICVNLAGVVTFMIQGIRPRTWWEADRAKKAIRLAISFWVMLLAALTAVILIAHHWKEITAMM